MPYLIITNGFIMVILNILIMRRKFYISSHRQVKEVVLLRVKNKTYKSIFFQNYVMFYAIHLNFLQPTLLCIPPNHLLTIFIVKHCPWDKSIHSQKNYMKISKDLVHIKILNNFSVVNLDFCLIYHLAMNLSTGFLFLFLMIYFTILFTTPAS